MATTCLNTFPARPRSRLRKEFVYVDDGGNVAAIRSRGLEGGLPGESCESPSDLERAVRTAAGADLCNLRRDPFEKAKMGSNTYEDWYIDRAYLLGPMQVVAARFLTTLKDYPPSQAPGDWSLESARGTDQANEHGRKVA
jgi:arylsulfatase